MQSAGSSTSGSNGQPSTSQNGLPHMPPPPSARAGNKFTLAGDRPPPSGWLPSRWSTSGRSTQRFVWRSRRRSQMSSRDRCRQGTLPGPTAMRTSPGSGASAAHHRRPLPRRHWWLSPVVVDADNRSSCMCTVPWHGSEVELTDDQVPRALEAQGFVRVEADGTPLGRAQFELASLSPSFRC